MKLRTWVTESNCKPLVMSKSTLIHIRRSETGHDVKVHHISITGTLSASRTLLCIFCVDTIYTLKNRTLACTAANNGKCEFGGFPGTLTHISTRSRIPFRFLAGRLTTLLNGRFKNVNFIALRTCAGEQYKCSACSCHE